MAAHALKTRTIKSKTKARKSNRSRQSRSGFDVKGHQQIEEKRREIAERVDPDQRLYGARGYRGIARELQVLVSKDQDRSLTAIARDTGIGMPTLKRIWSGRTRKPSFDTVEKIMSNYGLDLSTARRLSVVRD